MKLIVNPTGQIPASDRSHVRGWSMVWAEKLDATVLGKGDVPTTDDEVYLDHGVNFTGTLNLFGGATEDVWRRLDNLMDIDAVSLDRPCPDYGAQLKKRIGAKTTWGQVTEAWCDRLSEWCAGRMWHTMWNFYDGHAIIGDSHSPAYSLPDDAVLWIPGQTLHNLSRQIESVLLQLPALDRLTICAGSVDVRHHLCRPGAEPYVTMLDRLRRALPSDLRVDMCVPVPVEHAGRRIPKSGYYDGTAYYGHQTQRADMTQGIREYLEAAWTHGEVISPPIGWYAMHPQVYAERYMEMGGSFHIAPRYYRRRTTWHTTTTS